MTLLEGRVIEVTVDDIRLNGNRVTFHVEKTSKPDPNTAEVVIYNMTDSQRQGISAKKAPLVTLAAGYGKDLTQIFYGNLIHATHEIDGADIKTTLSTGDGIEEYRKARINASFGPKTPASTVFRALTKAMGLKPGNSDKFMKRFQIGLLGQIFLTGTTVSGSASRELTAICRSANLDWSIQDGKLQILDRTKALDAFAIKLDSTSGLVGSPSLCVKKGKTICTGKSLIIPDMFPGRQISLDSKFVKGSFVLKKCTYSGDTFGSDWYCEFEGEGFVPKIAKAPVSAATQRVLKHA